MITAALTYLLEGLPAFFSTACAYGWSYTYLPFSLLRHYDRISAALDARQLGHVWIDA